MKIIGLNVHSGQTAAALCTEDGIVAAVAEERFDRIKQSRAFPRRAIEFCLSRMDDGGFESLDGLAIAYNPGRSMEQINLSGFTNWRRYDPEWLYIVPNQLLSLAGSRGMAGDVTRLKLGGTGPELFFVDHHRAHMAHAAFQSPFERGAVAVVDEYGELSSVTLGRFQGNRLEILRTIDYPHSLGVFYGAVTEFLGFTPNRDEWKVMGAAALGDGGRYRAALDAVLPWDDKTQSWWLNQRYVEHANMKRAGYGNQALASLMGMPARRAEEPIRQEHYDLAAAAQWIFEDRMMRLLSSLAAATNEPALVAAGGCFMNSLANGRILERTPFSKLFVPYAAADNGTAMGAALYVRHVTHGVSWRPSPISPSPYVGPAFDYDAVRACLDAFKLNYRQVEDPAEAAAERIASGKIIGWFQGAMEFGERALGARSILADPRDAGMKDKINRVVKHREGFRPFAPAVPLEFARAYFELSPEVSVPYMEQVYPVRSEKRALLPAVTHADGTARLQTVTADLAPDFDRLLRAFGRMTGIPVVLNTSFNLSDEPIVCSPRDAVRTFYASGLDALLISRYVIDKRTEP